MINWREVKWTQYAQHLNFLKQWQQAEQCGDVIKRTAAERQLVACWMGSDLPDDADLITGIFLSIIAQPLPDTDNIKSVEHGSVKAELPGGLQIGDKHLIMGQISFGDALEALQADELMRDSPDRIPQVLQSLFMGGKKIDVSGWPVFVVLGLYKTFQQFRQQLTESYPVLFRSGSDGKARKAGIKRLNRFGWYNLLYEATGGRLEYFEAIKGKNLHTVMQFLLRKREEQHFTNRLQQVYAEEAKTKNRRP